MNAVFVAIGFLVLSFESNASSGYSRNVEPRFLKPRPLGVVRLDEPGMRSIRKAIEILNKQQNSKDTIADEVRLLAWCAKIDIRYLPPRLFEEIIAVVNWKDSTRYSLFYLRGSQSTDPSNVDWQVHSYWDDASILWRQDFSVPPSETQIAQFVRRSNFGNNEFDNSIIPIDIVLYEQQLPELIIAIKTGLSTGERAKRKQKVEALLGNSN